MNMLTNLKIHSRMSDRKRVKTDDDDTRSVPTTIQVRVAALVENPTDRCSLDLLESTVQWSATSHIVGPGDMVKITTRGSMWYGRSGWIDRIDSDEDGTYVIHIEDSPEQVFAARLHRGDFIYTHCRRMGYEWSAEQQHRDRAMAEFLAASGREKDRIARAREDATAEDPHVDQDGKYIRIGDIVAIDDEDHEFDKWICMVEAVGPHSMLKLHLGMPPTREQATRDEYEERRKERPRNRFVDARAQSVRLDGAVTPIEK